MYRNCFGGIIREAKLLNIAVHELLGILYTVPETELMSLVFKCTVKMSINNIGIKFTVCIYSG